MVDIQLIRQNPELMEQNLADRQMDKLATQVRKLLALDSKRRKLIRRIEALQAQHNALTSKIKPRRNEKLVQQARQLKKQIQLLKPEYNQIRKKYQALLWQMPNWTHPNVPLGKDEEDNRVLRKWGQPKQFSFSPKDHLELGQELDLIDTETAARVAGTRFNYLKNEAVLLQFALIQFVLETVTNPTLVAQIARSVKNPFPQPFVPVIPPVLMRPEVMQRMDRLEPIEERFVLEKDQLVLVGSAEHTLGPMHMEQTLAEEKLPLRYLGYSTAFRQEAGSYGKDTRGILRVHQFDKLEFESFSSPEHGEDEQNLLVALQEYFLQQLGLPYQVVAICTGDMGKPDYRQIDIETWLPGQNRYRETHTSDYMTDYQARRLKIRYSGKNGRRGFVHMNDATALAIGRTLIAILENYQQEDGSIQIPKVLQKYTHQEVIPHS